VEVEPPAPKARKQVSTMRVHLKVVQSHWAFYRQPKSLQLDMAGEEKD
jgi:hypothetical protein